MNSRDFILILVVSSIGVAFLTARILFSLRRRYRRKVFFRAHEMEKRAAQLLEDRGYRVLGEQVEKSTFVKVDGQKIPYKVRADYFLKKGRRTYIAEVKAGNQVASVLQPHTRRQLLEYYFIYRPQAVLLVDGERGEIEEVTFPYGSTGLKGWGWGLVLFLLGFMVGQWINRL